MSKYRWIYTTWPDAGLAKEAGQTLVEEGLCACVNILPGMTSVYRWQGAVETASEAVMILKTSAAKAPLAIKRLVALHPYDEPCAVGLEIDGAASAPAFLAWMDAAVSNSA
ncbi:divalent-cation tolerance protein CutA [uncultured Maricaulis sp.]|uniref:divalent-cation tolerance protein CutA n=1 Tax=uncultured Maricaulis sp. TaxID=174710 RepID=UPI0030D93179|tara:strand:- start:7709 stop:8041 length:333 start_codon:yes stop_codon:yes gene_type:complete